MRKSLSLLVCGMLGTLPVYSLAQRVTGFGTFLFPDVPEYRKCMTPEQLNEAKFAYGERLLSREVGPHQPDIYKNQNDASVFTVTHGQATTEQVIGYTCWAQRVGKPQGGWTQCFNQNNCNFGDVTFWHFRQAPWDKDLDVPGFMSLSKLNKGDTLAGWWNFGDEGMYGKIVFYYVVSPNPTYKP